MKGKLFFDNVSFRVKTNKINLLLGQNGAGKTTLINIISNSDTNYKGEILFPNEINQNNKSILYFRTHLKFPFHLKLFKLIKLFVESFGSKNISDNEITQKAKDFDLEDKLNSFPSLFSSGEKRKVILLLSELCSPKLLILDEPEANLDYTSRIKMYEKLKDFVEQGMTILLSTHMVSEIEPYADYAIFIKRGKGVIAEGYSNNKFKFKDFYNEHIAEIKDRTKNKK
ncbi:ABC transporter ATP-binding protein [Mycoplasmopsis californica]|uniref:ABC transporter ATP-binding protein n=1 Tax=Mycoplasmopsis equigenitalium TaxID=114883 RepID=A0ABY5J158_9BACT|nr:ABC transporter ATP-binding protein [Mycoplasmopsis equigenitalium]UUD36991.1 ABC transporter ATP-binding protein [Mycoplasmopsis equigenitalium]VEU69711.1 ABC transporter ATP-binding protein [Mycoplasmopsis californica]